MQSRTRINEQRMKICINEDSLNMAYLHIDNININFNYSLNGLRIGLSASLELISETI